MKITWLDYHEKAARIAKTADRAFNLGQFEAAKMLYHNAATAEDEALRRIPRRNVVGCALVKQANWLLCSGDLAGAERSVERALDREDTPAWARDALRRTLGSARGCMTEPVIELEYDDVAEMSR